MSFFRGRSASIERKWKRYDAQLRATNRRRSELAGVTDSELLAAARLGHSVSESLATAAIVSERVLGQRPFDEQMIGALAMVDGKIAEMQTGEGKTLAAALALCFLAKGGSGIHALTANDYLARRDAEWMGGIYRFLGLSVGFLAQGMDPVSRRQAYACDITYATANEVGFDYLRDGLVLQAHESVQRPFAAALIDEADSILIDEARIPLVIAGGDEPPQELVRRVAAVVGGLVSPHDFGIGDHGRNVFLTDTGIRKVESAIECGNLYHPASAHILAAVQNALHAAALLVRDVDYLVKDGRIELVDACKGRIAENRRWPAGLQTALEAKEGVALQKQGRVLGSVTLQNLVSLYPRLCGMTGTAATQAREFEQFYGLEVVPVPTHRPVIRQDSPDVIFPTREEKETALVRQIAATHATGRPILVGTASVAESERLSAKLAAAGIPHEVLNARNHERESKIVAKAGTHSAVTISTNMAGRGTDIPLEGEQVRALGGLYVVGTNRHESRRIDHQLRGRAGRQGDPGTSCFFLSLEDDLMQRYGISDVLAEHGAGAAIETVQRVIEQENLEICQMLWKYESLIEQQRRILRDRRDRMLLEGAPTAELNRLDEAWAEHLAEIADLRDGLCWIAMGGRDPFPDFLRRARDLFDGLLTTLDHPEPGTSGEAFLINRGATWTYVINDQPFGSLTERFVAGLRRQVRALLRRAS